MSEQTEHYESQHRLTAAFELMSEILQSPEKNHTGLNLELVDGHDRKRFIVYSGLNGLDKFQFKAPHEPEKPFFESISFEFWMNNQWGEQKTHALFRLSRSTIEMRGIDMEGPEWIDLFNLEHPPYVERQFRALLSGSFDDEKTHIENALSVIESALSVRSE